MRDRDLEEKISRLNELIELWNKFYEMTNAVLKGAEFNEEHNREFLDVKSSIARKYQSLAEKFPRKTFPDDEINNVLSTAVSFEHLKKLTGFAADEFQNLWHRVYISLNRQIGHLESARQELRKVSSAGVLAGRILRSKLFKLLIALLLVLVFLIARQQLSEPPPEVENETSEISTGDDAWTRVRNAVYSFIERFRREEPSEPRE